MSEHWARKYIGKEMGPNACWRMMREIYLAEFGIDLPEHAGITIDQNHRIAEAIEDEWTETEPFDGCGVAMGRKNTIHHVGIYVMDGHEGRILHCWNSTTIVADRAETIFQRAFMVAQFYRHRLWLG